MKENLLYGNSTFYYCPTNSCLLNDYSIEGVEEYDNIARFMPPVVSFIKNYNDMENNKLLNGDYKDGTDKYFHAKANFQAGQNAITNGLLGATLPTLGQILLLDIGKEVKDIAKKNGSNPNGYSLIDNLKDSRDDIYADLYGLGKGLFSPYDNAQNSLKTLRNKWINGNY